MRERQVLRNVSEFASREPAGERPEVRTLRSIDAADVFAEVGIGEQFEGNGGSPRFHIGFRVVDRDFNLQRSNSAASEAFGHMHFVAMRMATIVNPCFLIKSYRLGDERVALPLRNGVTEPSWSCIFGKTTAVQKNLAMVKRFVIKDEDHFRRLDDLPGMVPYK